MEVAVEGRTWEAFEARSAARLKAVMSR